MWQRYNGTTKIFEKSIDDGGSWLPLPLDAAIITQGAFAKAQQHAQTAYKDVNNTFATGQVINGQLDLTGAACGITFAPRDLSGATYALYNTSGDDIVIWNSVGGEIFRVANAGLVTLAAGLKFPAAQVASANVNTLDDYEEGTFTPTFVSSGGGAPTYSLQQGIYNKVGNGVWFTVHITTATLGTLATGSITIAGLPFTVAVQSWAAVSYFGGLATSMSSVGGAIQAGGTIIAMTFVGAAGSGSHALLAKADLGGITDIILGGYYTI